MLKNLSFVLKSVVVILLIQAVSAGALYYCFKDWPTRGQFGDMFGVINSLFSGLAFAGLVYTILLQQQELALQREELTLTRNELKRSAEASEKSEKALVRQAEAANQSARLSAINYLLAYYKAELDSFDKEMMFATDPKYKRKQELQRKQQDLLVQLDRVFNEAMGDINEQ
jgi:hypothetical protein